MVRAPIAPLPTQGRRPQRQPGSVERMKDLRIAKIRVPTHGPEPERTDVRVRLSVAHELLRIGRRELLARHVVGADHRRYADLGGKTNARELIARGARGID